MGQTYQKQFCSMQSPSITSTVSLMLQSGGAAAAAASIFTSIIMHSVFWTKCCCKYAEECMALPPLLWTRVTKAKIPMVTGGYGNGGRLDVNRTANAMGIWQCRYYSSAQKLQPLLWNLGALLFFFLSLNERYGTEMKILPTFCQYNRVKKPWKFEKLKNFKEKIDIFKMDFTKSKTCCSFENWVSRKKVGIFGICWDISKILTDSESAFKSGAFEHLKTFVARILGTRTFLLTIPR